jgi:hypothetical protein
MIPCPCRKLTLGVVPGIPIVSALNLSQGLVECSIQFPAPLLSELNELRGKTGDPIRMIKRDLLTVRCLHFIQSCVSRGAQDIPPIPSLSFPSLLLLPSVSFLSPSLLLLPSSGFLLSRLSRLLLPPFPSCVSPGLPPFLNCVSPRFGLLFPSLSLLLLLLPSASFLPPSLLLLPSSGFLLSLLFRSLPVLFGLPPGFFLLTLLCIELEALSSPLFYVFKQVQSYGD